MDSKNKHHLDAVIQRVFHWAEQRESVRAMLLISTRAVPNAPVDALSDYDVILVVEEIHPYYERRDWLKDFGEVPFL